MASTVTFTITFAKKAPTTCAVTVQYKPKNGTTVSHKFTKMGPSSWEIQVGREKSATWNVSGITCRGYIVHPSKGKFSFSGVGEKKRQHLTVLMMF